MTIELKPYQLSASRLLSSHLVAGAHFKFFGPTGAGRQVILAHALSGKLVLFVTNHSVMFEQFANVAQHFGIRTIDVQPGYVERNPEYVGNHDAVVLGEDIRSMVRIHVIEKICAAYGVVMISTP